MLYDANGKGLKNDLLERMKTVKLDGVDLILVKEHYLAERLVSMGLEFPKPIGILVLEDFSDLACLSESDLNLLGWFKDKEWQGCPPTNTPA